MEILIGPLTHRLDSRCNRGGAGRATRAEGQGRACSRVPAPRPHSLRWSTSGGSAAPLVGRDLDLQALLREHTWTLDERQCRLVTVLGEAGVGKSRLLAALDDSLEPDELFLKGRCLAYGRGITFWPLREAMWQAAAISDDDTPDVALGKLRELAGPVASGAVERVASAIGFSGAQFPVHEVIWVVPQAGRGHRRPAAARPRLRGRALGGGDLPRARRAPRGGGRGAGVARLSRAP